MPVEEIKNDNQQGKYPKYIEPELDARQQYSKQTQQAQENYYNLVKMEIHQYSPKRNLWILAHLEWLALFLYYSNSQRNVPLCQPTA